MMIGKRRAFSCDSGKHFAAGCACGTRRSFIASLGALATGAVVPASRTFA